MNIALVQLDEKNDEAKKEKRCDCRIRQSSDTDWRKVLIYLANLNEL